MAEGYINVYECPKGCKAPGGKPIAATIRGGKKHMTRKHGGWREEQLAQFAGGEAPGPNGKDLFGHDVEEILSGKVPGQQIPSAEDGAAAEGDPRATGPEQVKRGPFKAK